MRAPFFLVSTDNSDLWVFETLDDTIRSMEAIDVRNGEYIVFDAGGLQLELSAVLPKFWDPCAVGAVVVGPNGEPRPDDLRRRLRTELGRRGFGVQDVDIHELVACAVRHLK